MSKKRMEYADEEDPLAKFLGQFPPNFEIARKHGVWFYDLNSLGSQLSVQLKETCDEP
jgi:hypothetical protein